MDDMNQPPNLQNLFGSYGVRFVPGVGYVGPGALGAPGAALGRPSGLGDDASVMMISGLGSNLGDSGQPAPSDSRAIAVDPETGVVQSVTGAAFSIGAALSAPVTIGAVTLPLWGWLLIAAGGLTIAGYFFLYHKKK